jgi:hypothetical protein
VEPDGLRGARRAHTLRKEGAAILQLCTSSILLFIPRGLRSAFVLFLSPTMIGIAVLVVSMMNRFKGSWSRAARAGAVVVHDKKAPAAASVSNAESDVLVRAGAIEVAASTGPPIGELLNAGSTTPTAPGARIFTSAAETPSHARSPSVFQP